MTQKERLVELLDGLELPPIDTDGEMYLEKSDAEYIADYLLQNGVIVPPCKVGDVVFDIGGFPKIMEAEVETMTTDGQEMSSVVVNKSKPFHRWVVNWKDAGTYVFFTREAAEQALKERGE